MTTGNEPSPGFPNGTPTQATGLTMPVPATAEPTNSQKYEDIKELRRKFDEWVMTPIERLAKSQDALAAFILMSCAIDCLASFMWGVERNERRAVNRSYTEFIDEFFPSGRYEANDLYSPGLTQKAQRVT